MCSVFSSNDSSNIEISNDDNTSSIKGIIINSKIIEEDHSTSFIEEEVKEVVDILLPSRVLDESKRSKKVDDDIEEEVQVCSTSYDSIKVTCAFLNLKICDKVYAHSLLDTGANISAFSSSFFERNRQVFGDLIPLPEGTAYRCKAVNDANLRTLGKVKYSFRLGTRKYNYEAFVIDELKFDFVFGTDLIFYVKGAIDIYNRLFFFGVPRQSVDIDIGIDEDIVSALLVTDPFIPYVSVNREIIPPLMVQHILTKPSFIPEPTTRYFLVGDDTEDRWVCPGELAPIGGNDHFDGIHEGQGDMRRNGDEQPQVGQPENVSASTVNPPNPPIIQTPSNGQSPSNSPQSHMGSSNNNNNNSSSSNGVCCPSWVFLRVCNLSSEPLVIEAGERIALGVPEHLCEEKVVAHLDLGDWNTPDGVPPSREYNISSMISDPTFDDTPLKMNSKGEWEPSGLNLGSKNDLSDEQIQKLVARLREKILAFSTDPEDLGLTDLVELVLDTGDAPPQAQHPYRCSYEEEKWLENKIDIWLQKKVLRPSSGEWAAPCSLVRKKQGGYRLVIDYRRLNSVLKNIQMHWPLTLIDSCLDTMYGSQYFSALDINQAFEQVPVEHNSIPKTGFVCKFGHFEFLRAPQGVKNMPSTFTKLTDLIFQGLKWKIVNIFADDILIYSRTFNTHLDHIDLILDRIIAAGLKLKLPKCVWAQYEVDYLGHLINREGIKPSPSKVESVLTYPTPNTPKKVHSFVSLCSYYRRFIRNFSTLTAPLTDLVHTKQRKFTWTSECESIFAHMKTLMTTAPILVYPDFSKAFYISTDASNIGLGAILFQYDSNNLERVISYASRSLLPAERNYSATHKEGLGVIWAATKKFHPYVYGQKFYIITDHKPLVHLFKVRDSTGRLYRWSIKLQEYDYEIIYKPGRSHTNVDVLSRIPEEVVSSIILDFDYDYINYINHTPSLVVISSLELDDSSGPSSQEYAPDWTFSLDILLEQKKDPTTSSIIEDISTQGSTSRSYPDYYIHPQTILLMHLYFPTNTRKHRDAFHQVVVPVSLQHHVLKAYHDHPLGGHMSPERTYEKILHKYFWPTIRTDIFHYVHSCEVCSKGKTPRRRPPLPVGMQPQVYAPFQRISMDFLEVSITPRKNRYVLVLIDAFSRWVEVFPTQDELAGTVARIVYDNIITRYGCPHTLLSDNGPSFIAKIVEELCLIMSVKKIFTTAHHPQSNGLVERVNSTVLSTLRSYVDEMGSDWDLCLPSVRFAINTTPNSTTGLSPFYINFGLDPRLPLDTLIEPSVQFVFSDLGTYARHTVDRVRKAYQIVNAMYDKKLTATQEINRQNAGKIVSFSIGDQVWLYIPIIKKGYSRKLHHPWHGPYRIVGKISEFSYNILPCDGNTRKVIKVHVARLKPYHERIIDIPILPRTELFAEDPSIPPTSEPPALPDRNVRIIYDHPEIPSRAPTALELSYVGKEFRDPDDGKCFIVTKCTYSKKYRHMVYDIILLRQLRTGDYRRTTSSYQCCIEDVQYWCDHHPLKKY